MYKWVLFLFIFGVVCLAKAEPHRVVIIRHGEKVSDADSRLGPKGCERAYLLPRFFSQFTGVAAIYAQQIGKIGGSVRSMATMAPSAKAMNLRINNRFRRVETKALAQEILESSEYRDRTVLVAWEHDAIVDLAEDLGLDLKRRFKEWPANVYDQAWVLNFESKKKIKLEIIAEYLLPGDIDPSQSGKDNWGEDITPLKNNLKVPEAIAKKCRSSNSGIDELTRALVIEEIPGF